MCVVISKERNRDEAMSAVTGIGTFQSNFNLKSPPLNTIWGGSALRVSEDAEPMGNEETALPAGGQTSSVHSDELSKEA